MIAAVAYLLDRQQWDAVMAFAASASFGDQHLEKIKSRARKAVLRGLEGDRPLREGAPAPTRPAGLLLDGYYAIGERRFRVVSRVEGYLTKVPARPTSTVDAVPRRVLQVQRTVVDAMPLGPGEVLRNERGPSDEGWRGFAFVGSGKSPLHIAVWRRFAGDPWLKMELDQLLANPEAAVEHWTKTTATCAVCGRELRNEASIARGIGPICAARSY